MNFTEQERYTIANSLRVAATKFAENAGNLAADVKAGTAPAQYARIAEQFERQATESLRLAQRFEEED